MFVIVWFVFYLSVFFFNQKTAYEMRISDWSSDVCSSDLMLLAVLDNRLHRYLGAVFEFDEGARGFAPTGIGSSHHGGGQYGWVAVQNIFHLDGGYVFASRDNDVFAATFDLYVAVGVHDG